MSVSRQPTGGLDIWASVEVPHCGCSPSETEILEAEMTASKMNGRLHARTHLTYSARFRRPPPQQPAPVGHTAALTDIHGSAPTNQPLSDTHTRTKADLTTPERPTRSTVWPVRTGITPCCKVITGMQPSEAHNANHVGVTALRTRMLLRAAILIGATGGALALAGPAFADNQPRPGGGPVETLVEETLTTVVKVVDPILPDPERAPTQEQPTPVRDAVDAALPDPPGEQKDEPRPTPVRDAVADVRDPEPQPEPETEPGTELVDAPTETPGPAVPGSSPQHPADQPPAPATPTALPDTGLAVSKQQMPARTPVDKSASIPVGRATSGPTPQPAPTNPGHETVTSSAITSYTATNHVQPDVTTTSHHQRTHPTADRIRAPDTHPAGQPQPPDPAPG